MHKTFCTKLQEFVTGTVYRFALIQFRKHTVFIVRFLTFLGVDNTVTDEFNDFGCTVLTLCELEQLRCFLNEGSIAFSGNKGRMMQYVDQERNICFYATDTHFL